MDRRNFIHTLGLGTTALLVLPDFVVAAQKNLKHLFVDGDVVMLIGDSITHDGRWHTFVRNYYLTRFPDANITFINSGISGDSTNSVLNRMNEDILIHKPNKIAIMLGMNNTGNTIYTSGKPKEEIETEKARLINLYQNEMKKIVGILKDKYHPQFIFITPTIYDQAAQIPQKADFGRNDTLKVMSAFVKNEAIKENALLVDFYGQMQAVNSKLQLTNPALTIIGNDRVHPGFAGNHLMAYYFLKAQGVPDSVSETVLNFRAKKAKTKQAKISNLEIASDKVSFNLLEYALPYPIANDAKQVLDWAPVNELNKQIIKIKNIPTGKYALSIDDNKIGEFTSEDLVTGINLAGNAGTPQYQQAQALYIKTIAAAVKVSTQRTIFQVGKMVEKEKINPNDIEALKVYQARMNAQSTWHGGIISMYIKYIHQPALLVSQIKEIENEINRLKQPITHNYTFKKV